MYGRTVRSRQFAFLNVRTRVRGRAKDRKREREGELGRNVHTGKLSTNLNVLSRRLLFIYSISSFVYSTARPLLNPGFFFHFSFSPVHHRRRFLRASPAAVAHRAESNDLDTPAGTDQPPIPGGRPMGLEDDRE